MTTIQEHKRQVKEKIAMKKRMFSSLLALVLALTLLLPTFAFAEELGEFELYAPEVYTGEQAVEAPAPVEPAAEQSAADEPIIVEDPAAYAVAAPELAPMDAAQYVALTEKKASAQMNVGETLQIVVNPGEIGTFATGKAAVAAVDANGLVTALAKGKAKITFAPEGGKKRTLSLVVVDSYEPKGISLAEGKTVALTLGQSIQLNAVLNPATAISALAWTSSKPGVAVVDANGVVTAVGEGKAKITVKTANKKKAKLTVTVTDPYKPSGIALVEGKATSLTVGQSLQLNAVLSPAGAISALEWTSSKPKVAVVDANGVVTAVGEGKAKITVKTANKKKAKLTVTVTDPYKPSGIAIVQGSTMTLNAGEGVQLTAVLAPANAISALSWMSSKPGVAVVDANGIVTAIGKGTATITVATGNGKKAKCKVTVQEKTEVTVLTELIGYLTPDGARQLINEHSLKELYPENDGQIEYYGKDGDEIRVDLDYGEGDGEWITIHAASPVRYSLDGVNTTMTVSEAKGVLQGKGWQESVYFANSFKKDGGYYEYYIESTDGVRIDNISATFRHEPF